MPKWILPWPTGVSTNHLYQRNRNGGMRLADRAQAWKDEVISTVLRPSREQIPDGPLQVTIIAFPPNDRRRHDVDNLAKLTLDTIFGEYEDDDARVAMLVILRGTGRDPHLTVQIEPLQADLAGWLFGNKEAS